MTPRARGAFLAALMLTLATGAGIAHAASNDPTPYTVTADGITLPAGTVFPAHGHVNWRTTSSSGGIHFDPNNNQPGGAYIGKSFLPITLAPGECITWVQISLYDEHYGEGGQDPICKPTTTPEPTEEPTWDPEPTNSAEPTDSPTTSTETSSEPQPNETSTTPTEPSNEPESTSETPETQNPATPSPTPSPTTTGSTQPTNSPTPGPDSPSSTPDPTGTPTTPAPIQCDPGYAPGWLDENGVPTGCVANGPIDPEPEETPWTPTETPSSQPSNEPSVTPGTSTSPPAPTTPRTKPRTNDWPGSPPSATSTAPGTTSLAATGSDTAVWVAAAALTLLLGAYLTTTNHRRKP